MTNKTLSELTGDWFPELPRAYEKSIVLGGGTNLFPIDNPQDLIETLNEYVIKVASRAYREGNSAAKAEIRRAIFQ